MASRADSKSISPISRWLLARTQSPPSLARTATRTAAKSEIAVCAASNAADCSLISAPVPGLRPVPENIAYYVRGPLPTVDGRAPLFMIGY